MPLIMDTTMDDLFGESEAAQNDLFGDADAVPVEIPGAFIPKAAADRIIELQLGGCCE
jgi:hypothetical protein